MLLQLRRLLQAASGSPLVRALDGSLRQPCGLCRCFTTVLQQVNVHVQLLRLLQL